MKHIAQRISRGQELAKFWSAGPHPLPFPTILINTKYLLQLSDKYKMNKIGISGYYSIQIFTFNQGRTNDFEGPGEAFELRHI